MTLRRSHVTAVAADGVQPLDIPNMLPTDIARWQRVVPAAALTIGFGALYAAWGSANCARPGAVGGVNQTCSLALSLAACKAAGVRSVHIFSFNVFGCAARGVNSTPGMCQIAGPWPPDSWWPLLRAFAHGRAWPVSH